MTMAGDSIASTSESVAAADDSDAGFVASRTEVNSEPGFCAAALCVDCVWLIEGVTDPGIWNDAASRPDAGACRIAGAASRKVGAVSRFEVASSFV